MTTLGLQDLEGRDMFKILKAFKYAIAGFGFVHKGVHQFVILVS